MLQSTSHNINLIRNSGRGLCCSFYFFVLFFCFFVFVSVLFLVPNIAHVSGLIVHCCYPLRFSLMFI